ncbi:MAG: S-layer homology domain-containing protein [Clostridia bacterium]|nr:S-layer homology domain-containing protein [Clostridia bacterium]
MKKVISLVSFILVLVMLASGATVFGSQKCKDFENIETLWGWDGYPDGTFRPNELISRAEFVCYLYKFHNHLHEEVYVYVKPIREYKNNFTDISPKEWYYQYVVWAYERGIINGVGDGKFDPESTINVFDYSLMMKRLYSAAFTKEWDDELDPSYAALGRNNESGDDNYMIRYYEAFFKNAVLIKMPTWYTKETSIEEIIHYDIWIGGSGEKLDMTKFTPTRGEIYKHSHNFTLWVYSS